MSFSLFNDRWALATADTPEDYNTMTIGRGTMGTIWGPPKGGKQIIEVFLGETDAPRMCCCETGE